ncbi:hypothetical protein [Streptomyces sp. Isolate_219]|uniref:hypothetical protein n=1 Tax=Streptomyces sp. Isolate_219 TaxID=2950110 RepID=UPI0021C7837F|nr:hypothetical protein [Streptomyces sp. Isolate_219]MCR8574704.1 hypothetical protein [Streptomyces sp. Isolate_219]
MPAHTIPSSNPAPRQRRLIAAGILASRTPDAPAPVAPSLSAHLRDALGMRHLPAPRPEIGETDTRRCVWSVRELDDVYAHAGGTVTARQVERTIPDGSPYAVIEVTVTVTVPNVGTVEVFTDWGPAEEPHGLALPVIRALSAGAAR